MNNPFVLLLFGILGYVIINNYVVLSKGAEMQENFLSHIEKWNLTPEQKLEALKSWNIKIGSKESKESNNIKLKNKKEEDKK